MYLGLFYSMKHIEYREDLLVKWVVGVLFVTWLG